MAPTKLIKKKYLGSTQTGFATLHGQTPPDEQRCKDPEAHQTKHR